MSAKQHPERGITMNIKNITLSSGIASRMGDEKIAEYVRECLDKFRKGDFGDYFKSPDVRGGIVSTTYKKEGMPYVCISLDTDIGEAYVSTTGEGEVCLPNVSVAMATAVGKQVERLTHIIHAWDEWMEWFSGCTNGPEPTAFPVGYRYPDGIWDYMGDWNAQHPMFNVRFNGIGLVASAWGTAWSVSIHQYIPGFWWQLNAM